MMRKSFFLSALFLSLVLVGCGASEPRSGRETSPSGMDYALIANDDWQDVSIQVAWPTDWAFRSGLNQAVPYLGVNTILTGGAEGYPSGSGMEKLSRLQAQSGLFLTHDYVWLAFSVPKKNLDEALAVVNAHLRSPAFDAATLKAARVGLTERIKKQDSNLAVFNYKAADWFILQDQPLRQAQWIDPPGLVQTATSESIRSWHRQFITGESARVVVAGDITPAEAGKAVDGLFRGLPRAAPAETEKLFTAFFQPQTLLIHKPEAANAPVTFMAPFFPAHRGGKAEDEIILKALVDAMRVALTETGRIDARSRDAFKISIDGYAREYRVLLMETEAKPDQLADVVNTIQTAYARFRQDGFFASFDRDKKAVARSLSNGRRDADALALLALYEIIDGRDAEAALTFSQSVEKAGVEEVKARLETVYPTVDEFLIVATSPKADALPGSCVINEPWEAPHCY